MAVRWHVFLSMRRLFCVILFYILMLIVFPLLAYLNKGIAHEIVGIYHNCIQRFKKLCDNRKQVLINILTFAIVTVFDVVGILLYKVITGNNVNTMITYLVLGITYLCTVFYLLKNDAIERPEKLFFCSAMIVGSILITASPRMNGLTWDDDTHYLRLEAITCFADEQGYAASDMMMQDYAQIALQHDHYSEAERVDYEKKLNLSYANGEIGSLSSALGIYSVCYVHEAAAVMIGRFFHLPFTWILCLAKFSNLFLYAFIGFLAIKKLKFGKILASCILLLPTVLFMASNFSYDPWLICFMMYGFCYFFSFLQNREKKMTKRDMILILGSFALGILPKAVYFIYMLPLFLIPAKSFCTKKEHHIFLRWLFITGLFLASTFVLPVLFGGMGSGDARGGAEVNASEQLRFIIQNPSLFISIIVRFLSNYLYIGNAPEYTTFLGYFGEGTVLRDLPIILIIFVAVLDKIGQKSKNLKIVLLSVISFFITVFIIATALYISFTPVGLDTVNGCQYRYLIPLLFPLLYMICPDGLNNKINKSLFNMIPIFLISSVFLINTMVLLAKIY